MAEFNKRLIYQIIRKMSQLQSKKMHTAAPTKAAQKKKNEKKKRTSRTTLPETAENM